MSTARAARFRAARAVAAPSALEHLELRRLLAVDAASFQDGFNRADNAVVGKGWAEGVDDAWVVEDNSLLATTIGPAQWDTRQLLRPGVAVDANGSFVVPADNDQHLNQSVLARRQADGSAFMITWRNFDGRLEVFRLNADGSTKRLGARTDAVPNFDRATKAYRVEWSISTDRNGDAHLKATATDVAAPADFISYKRSEASGPREAGEFGLVVYGYSGNASWGRYDDVSFSGLPAYDDEDDAPAAPAPTVPVAPTNLAATGADRSVAVTWTDPPEAAGVLGIRVLRSVDGGAFEERAVVAPGAGIFIDVGLANGIAVGYQLQTLYGDGAASDVTAAAFATPIDTVVPAAPVDLTAAAVNGVVALSWSDPADADLATVRVLRAVVGGEYAPIAEVTPGVESYVDATAEPGVEYLYAVAAVDDSGNASPRSTPARAYVEPDAPAEPALPFADGFDRPDGESVGPRWVETGPASAWSIVNGQLFGQSTGAGQWSVRQLLVDGLVARDLSGGLTVVSGTADMTYSFAVRVQDDGAFYLLSFRAYDGKLEAYRVSSSGAATRIGSQTSPVPGFSRAARYRLSFDLSGGTQSDAGGPTQIKLSVAQVGNAANSVTLRTSDSLGPQAAGRLGLTQYGYASRTASGTIDDVRFDVAGAADPGAAGGSTTDPLAAGVVTASVTGATTATLAATDADGGTAPYRYQWHLSTTPNFTPDAGTAVGGAMTRTLDLSGLDASTTYYAKLVYADAGGATASSAEVTFTTDAAPPPVGGGPNPTGLPIADDFNRAADNLVDHGWVEVGPSDAYQVQDNRLLVRSTGAGQWSTRQLLVAGASVAEIEGGFTVVGSGAPLAADMTYAVAARVQDDGRFYMLSFRGYDGRVEVYRVDANGSATRVGSRSNPVPGYSPSKSYRVSFKVSGGDVDASQTRFEIRAFEVANDANAVALTTSDRYGPQGAGRVGLAVYGYSSRDGSGAIDNVELRQIHTTPTPPTPGTGNAVVFAHTAPQLLFSPANWYRSAGGYAVANNPGASFRAKFTGGSFTLLIDPSNLKARPLQIAEIAWRVDGGAWQYRNVVTSDGRETLASGLSTGPHTIEIALSEITRLDRWQSPEASLRVKGVELAAGGTLQAIAPKAKQILVYGDSITEGSSSTSANTHDSVVTYAYKLAEHLDADIGLVGFSGQGWNDTGVGSVPTFMNTWDQVYSGAVRDFSGVDAILVTHGTNDRNGSASAVRASVTSWIAGVRAKVGAGVKILLGVPPGGHQGNAIYEGLQDYRAANPGDAEVYFVNLGRESEFNGTSDPLMNDDLHPNVAGHASLAIDYAAAVQAALVA